LKVVSITPPRVQRVAGGVLVDSDEARDAAALEVLAADEMAGALGGDEGDVDLRRRLDLAVVHGEAVAEEQRLAGRDAVPDVLLPDLAVLLVGQQHHYDVAARGRLGHVGDLQAVRARLLDGG
jgi:hypothetical protein